MLSVEKNNRFLKILNSSALMFMLAFLNPIIFLTLPHIHSFYLPLLLKAYGYIFLLSLAYAVFGYLVDCGRARFTSKTSQQIIYLLIAFLTLFIPFQYLPSSDFVYLDNFFPTSFFMPLMLFLGTLFVYFFIRFCSLKTLHKVHISIFCVGILLLPVQFFTSYTRDVSAVDDAFHDFPLDQNLQNKPNIYVFLLEAYHGLQTQEEVYGIDTSVFAQKLQADNFIIYDNVYSNVASTLGSLLNLYLMQSDIADFAVDYRGIEEEANELIAGFKNNVLFSYLNKEGYEIASYFAGNPENYVPVQGPLLDNTNAITPLEKVLERISPHLEFLLTQLNILPKSEEVFCANILPEMLAEIEKASQSKKPHFSLFLSSDELTVREEYINKSYQDWISSGIYQQGIQFLTVDNIIPMVDKIALYDPNALVILLGDHGANFFAPFPKERANRVEFNLPALNDGCTIMDIARDTRDSFLAVKMPDYAVQDIRFGYPISHANLFRHIFAALENNTSYLENRVPDISKTYYYHNLLVEDGEIIQKDRLVFPH